VWRKSRLALRTVSLMVDWNRETFNIVVELAHETASVMMNWNMKTSSVIDGLAQGVASVMVHVCTFRIRKVNYLLLEKKDHTYLTRMSVWR